MTYKMTWHDMNIMWHIIMIYDDLDEDHRCERENSEGRLGVWRLEKSGHIMTTGGLLKLIHLEQTSSLKMKIDTELL